MVESRRAADPIFLQRLTAQFRQRLVELEAEQAVIHGVLAALDAGETSRPPLSNNSVLAALHADPGVRATMLGLQFGLPTEVVSTHLEQLESAGLAQKSGLGWIPRRVTPTSRSSAVGPKGRQGQ
jgi:hypothetical protein